MKSGNFVIFLSAMLVFLGCSSKETVQENDFVNAKEAEQIVVKTVIAQKTAFTNEILSNGKAYARNKAELYFKLNQPIEKVNFENGDYVTKGDTIAILQNYELKNQMEQSRAQLERSELDFSDALIGQGYEIEKIEKIPDHIVHTAKIRSGFLHAQSVYDLAEYNYSQSFLIAPLSGVIANLFNSEMNLPLPNQPFCSVINNDVFQLEFPILESEIKYLHRGQEIMLSPFFDSDVQLTGTIKSVNPAVNDNGMVVVLALVRNKERFLTQGMNVKVTCEQQLQDKIIIPKKAVTLRADREVVFTVENDLAKWNYVSIEHENSGYYALNGGINENDLVIIDGNTHLANHSKVKIAN